MTKDAIKFPNQVKREFITELRGKVNDYFETRKLSKFGNANLVIKTIFMFTLYLGPFLLVLTGIIDSLPLIIMSFVLMGAGMAGVGMGLMHDANHGSYSKNKHINTLIGSSLYLLGGSPLNWQYQHNTLHHGYTNIDGYDEDIAPLEILRFSPHKPLYKVHQFQQWYAWFFYGLMTISWITIKDFKQLLEYKNSDSYLPAKTSYKTLVFRLILSKLFYYAVFLVLPLLFLSVSWYWVVLAFVLMHFTCGFILAIIFQTAHVVPSSEYPRPDENGNLENNWAIHQLLTTSDFAPKSRIFSWLIGGLNYQVEHHLFPNISHVHYKKLSALVKETAEKYGLPYYVETTFIAALANHAKMLKILGKKPIIAAI